LKAKQHYGHYAVTRSAPAAFHQRIYDYRYEVFEMSVSVTSSHASHYLGIIMNNTSIDQSELRAERQRKLALHMLAKMDKVLHMVSHEIREAKIASAGDVQKKMKEDLAIIKAGGSVADPPEPNIPPLDLPQTLPVDHQQLLPSDPPEVYESRDVTRTQLREFAHMMARHIRRRIYEGQGFQKPVKTRILVDLLVVDPREDQRGHERVSVTSLQAKNFVRQVVMNTRQRVFREPTYKRRSVITERRKMNAEHKARMSKPDPSPVGECAVGGNDHAN
jgi:hypothetical protein